MSGIRKCIVNHGSQLLLHLQHLERLEKISFHNTRLNVAIMKFLSSLISMCRSLTHLTCNTTFAAEGILLSPEGTLVHHSEINHNMRFIRLGLHSPSLRHAMLLLVRCPELSYFSTSCVNDIDARMVLSACPKLAFFECQILAKRYRQWLQHEHNDLESPSHSSSVVQQQQQPSSSSTCLRELTLEPISFEQQVLDLHHPFLQRLELGVINGEEEITRTLLRNTPMLEELHLCFYDLVDYIPAAIRSLSNLRSLHLSLLRTREQHEGLISLFQGFHRLPSHLAVGINCNLYQQSSPEVVANILMSLAGIHQLKYLNLHSHQDIDDNHLITFFEHVTQHVETVIFAFPSMSSSLLSVMANRLHHLELFEIAFCGNISRDGLRTLVDTKARTSPGKLLLKIRLSYMDDGTKASDINVRIGQDDFPLIQQ